MCSEIARCETMQTVIYLGATLRPAHEATELSYKQGNGSLFRDL